MKRNCWEVKECGRQPGGNEVRERGECPAARCFSAHGINSGINGGRACWAISGTYCEGRVQGTFAEKIDECTSCDFYALVHQEEGPLIKPIYEILQCIGPQH